MRLHHRAIALAVAVGLLAAPSHAAAQAPIDSLTDAQVDAAIALGVNTKSIVGAVLGVRPGSIAAGLCNASLREGLCGFTVVMQSATGRIATLAAMNAKKYLPFTRDSVPPELRAPLLYVEVIPQKPTYTAGRSSKAPNAEHIVIRRWYGKEAAGEAIQPLRVEPVPVQWGNGYGATFDGQGLRAIFDARKLPQGDIALVLVTSGKELEIPVRPKNWAEIDQPGR